MPALYAPATISPWIWTDSRNSLTWKTWLENGDLTDKTLITKYFYSGIKRLIQSIRTCILTQNEQIKYFPLGNESWGHSTGKPALLPHDEMRRPSIPASMDHFVNPSRHGPLVAWGSHWAYSSYSSAPFALTTFRSCFQQPCSTRTR